MRMAEFVTLKGAKLALCPTKTGIKCHEEVSVFDLGGPTNSYWSVAGTYTEALAELNAAMVEERPARTAPEGGTGG